MRAYFVRHGESEFNIYGNIHQHKNVGLSKNGIKQAEFIAKRFLKIPIDGILSSDYVRTHQTAEIIGRVLQKEIEYLPFLRELKKPSEIEGKHYDDSEAIRIKKLIREHEHDADWHYSDEENLFDFSKRASKFLEYVSKRKENSVLVMTHGKFIQMCLCVILFGSSTITPEEYGDIEKKTQHKNTGITLFEYTESKRWHLVTWNDHAHLG